VICITPNFAITAFFDLKSPAGFGLLGKLAGAPGRRHANIQPHRVGAGSKFCRGYGRLILN
jgi:hypothetical protein